jgi:hypothetical protein
MVMIKQTKDPWQQLLMPATVKVSLATSRAVAGRGSGTTAWVVRSPV